MKRCPKCMREYDDDALFCKIDGEDLVRAIPIEPRSAAEQREEESVAPDELPDITVMHYGGDFNEEPTSTAALAPPGSTQAAPTATRHSGTARSSSTHGGSHDVEDPFQGQVLEGRYRILERLSVGGMGMVYRAVDTNLNDLEVAIKFIRPEIAKRSRFRQIFQDAELLLAKIQNSNVVRVYNFDETEDGYLYLVMDFVPGQSLRHYIYRRRQETTAKSRRREIRDETELLRQIASGLQAMHRAGIVHRDLKPDNILLQPQPGGGHLPRIIDFGIATQVDPETGQTPLDDASRIMSTNYAPPEQILHEPMNFRSDVFSFGLMAYELLARQNPLKIRTTERSRTRRTPRSTSSRERASEPGPNGSAGGSRSSTGSSPSVDESMLESLDRIDRIPSLRRLAPEVPRALERIVLRCLEYDPDQRYDNAGIVQKELARFLAQRRRIHALLSIAAVLLLLAGGALGIALSGRQSVLRAELTPEGTAPFDMRAGDVGILHVGREVGGDLRLSLAPNATVESGEIFFERDGQRWDAELRLRDLEARLPRRRLDKLPDGEYTLYLRLEGAGGRPFMTSPRSLRLHKDTLPPRFNESEETLRTDVPHRWVVTKEDRPTLFVGKSSFELQGEIEDANLKSLTLWDLERNDELAEHAFDPSDGDQLAFALPIEGAYSGSYELVAMDWAGNVARLPFELAVRSGSLPLDLRLRGAGLPADGLSLDHLERLALLPLRGEALFLVGGSPESEPVPLVEVSATLAGTTYGASEGDLASVSGERLRSHLLQIPLDDVAPFEVAEIVLVARDALGRRRDATLRVRLGDGPRLTLAGLDLHDEGDSVVVARIPNGTERLHLRADGVALQENAIDCRITISSEGAKREISPLETRLEETAATAHLYFSPELSESGVYGLQVSLTDELQQRVELLDGRPVYLIVDHESPAITLGPAFTRALPELEQRWMATSTSASLDAGREIWVLNAAALEKEKTALRIIFRDVDLRSGRVQDVDQVRTRTFEMERDASGASNLESSRGPFLQDGPDAPVELFDPEWIGNLLGDRRETRLDIELEDGSGHRTERRLLVLVDKQAPRIEIVAPPVELEGSDSEEWIVTDSRFQIPENEILRVRFQVQDGESGPRNIRFNGGVFHPLTGGQFLFEEPVTGSHLVAEATDWAGNKSHLTLRVPRPPSETLPWRLPRGEPVTFRLVSRGPFIMGSGQRLPENERPSSLGPFETAGSENNPSRPEKEVVLEHDLYLSENEITNAQYRTFLLEGGYEKDEYWDLAWTVETVDGPKLVDAATWAQSPDGEPLAAELSHPGLWLDRENRRQLFTAADGRLGPRRWRDDRWPEDEEADHPVTGVSFVEAMAFCRWLGSLYGVEDHLRLPNEREWEAAARRNPAREPRRYVWGERWVQYRCHFARPQKAPVHVFAGADGDVSASGLFNLAGNVSEWVVPYPVHYAPGARMTWYKGVYRGGNFDDYASSDPTDEVQLYFTTFVHREASLLQRESIRGFRCLIHESDLPRELRD